MEPSSVGMVPVILNRHRLAVYRYLCSRLAAHGNKTAHGKLIFSRFIFSVTKSCYKNVHKSIYGTSIVPYLFLFFGYYFTLLTIFLTNSLTFPSLNLHNVDYNLVLLAGRSGNSVQILFSELLLVQILFSNNFFRPPERKPYLN